MREARQPGSSRHPSHMTSRVQIVQTASVRPTLHAVPAVLPLAGGQDGATVTLRPLLCGEIHAPAGWFEAQPGLTGTLRALGVGIPKEQRIPVPIVAFLVEHPGAGAILIDTGFHRVIADGAPAERSRNLGPLRRLLATGIRMRPEQTAAAQLRALGIEPREVSLIVMTHLHFDHASALADFPAATVLVSAPEWRAANARGASLQGYVAAQLDPRPAYRTVDFHGGGAHARGPFERALDLFGDGSLILLDTPGHSAGHLSVLARLREREALIAGDAIYTLATLREGQRPWHSQNRRAFERSVRALGEYDREHPDALIVPGHDMAHWETLAERYE
jgi:N-acyl homoserine lactone hydrolase